MAEPRADLPPRPGYRFPGSPSPDVLAYLEDKGLKPAFSWLDVWGEEHAGAFTVAKMTGLDLLSDVRESLVRAEKEGIPFERWAREIKPRLVAAGWWGRQEMTDPLTGETKIVQLGSPRRLRTIFTSNMRSARAAGQWARIQRTKAGLPYLLYELGPSREHRPGHVARAGMIRPVDDPIWAEWMPPNGWGCKCRVRQVTEAEATRRGVSDPPNIPTRPHLNWRTGEITDVPVGIDPGWHTNPGMAREAILARLVARRWAAMPPDWAGLAARTRDQVLPALRDDVARWVDQVAARGQARGERRIVGALSQRVVEGLLRHGVRPSQLALHLDDRVIAHMLRDAKAARGAALTVADIRRLVDIVAAPEAVLFDTVDPAVLYVFPAASGAGKMGKVVVRIDWRTNIKTPQGRTQIALNAIRTGGLVQPENLRVHGPGGAPRYDVLEGTRP